MVILLEIFQKVPLTIYVIAWDFFYIVKWQVFVPKKSLAQYHTNYIIFATIENFKKKKILKENKESDGIFENICQLSNK